ncbi:MAG: hypothetical protein CVU06_15655, partial [Bacteroidetes bacterium HGW-Bacteroidetes-22]
MIRNLILSFLMLVGLHSAVYSSGKDGLKLQLKIEGISDTVLYLAHYYGDKQYVDDTARLGRGGWYTFSADTLLPGGMYIIAGQKKVRYLEFLLDKQQQVTIETKFENIAGSIKVKGSEDVSLFFSYINYLSARQKEVTAWQKCIERNGKDSDSALWCKKQIAGTDSVVRAYISGFVAGNKGLLVAAFVGAQSEPRIPEAPKLANGAVDSLFAFRYYKNHFFDSFDLGDDRLIRTPVYHQKLNLYFTKLVLQSPDSIESEVERLLPLVKKGRDTYRYFVWYLTNYVERSEIMGMDAAFVYMVDQFYASGEMDFWINKQV